MSKKYIILCERNTNIYGDQYGLFWGYKESKNGYTHDPRLAHRFEESEIERFDIPLDIDKLGLSCDYEENINENLLVLVEKGTINNLYGLKLSK